MPIHASRPHWRSLLTLVLGALLMLGGAAPLAAGLVQPEAAGQLGMGAPLPTSWDTSKPNQGAPTPGGWRLDVAPEAATGLRYAGATPLFAAFAPVASATGRTLLLHWGRLLLEGG